jgi:hypothetical protein
LIVLLVDLIQSSLVVFSFFFMMCLLSIYELGVAIRRKQSKLPLTLRDKPIRIRMAAQRLRHAPRPNHRAIGRRPLPRQVMANPNRR